jgi:excisionase family DNA binding protein
MTQFREGCGVKRQEMDSKKLLSPKELAAYLGVAIGTIYSYTYQKQIPYIKIGRLARFDPAEVEIWINARKIEPFRMKSKELYGSI